MAIDAKTFQDQFEVFSERVVRKSKAPFTSFREGFAADWEGYKLPLRKKALTRLGASWCIRMAAGLDRQWPYPKETDLRH